MFVSERLDWSGRTLAATIENANGAVYVVSDAQSRQLAAGEQLQKGERVRTAKDSNALLRLADGSTVEMRERSEFSVTENRRGVTVRLERGDVIVEAFLSLLHPVVKVRFKPFSDHWSKLQSKQLYLYGFRTQINELF